MNQRTVKIKLSEQAKRTFASRFSSDNLSSSAQSLLVPLDILYTIVARYDRVIENDLLTAQGDPVTSQGSVIDYTVTHPAVAAITTVFFATVGIISAYFHINYLKKIKNNGSTHYIKEQLEAAIKAEQANQELPVHDINYYLDLILSDNPDLQNKYESVKIDGTDLDINYKNPAAAQAEPERQVVHHAGPQGAQSETEVKTPGQKSSWFEKFSRKVLSPAWEALNLSAFTFWIMWIGTGLFTGQFDLGITGMSPYLAFGIPIAVGLSYPILKVYNYFKNRGTKQVGVAVSEESVVTPEDEKNGCELMRRAFLRREFELEKADLKAQLAAYKIIDVPEPAEVAQATGTPASKLDQKILTLGKGKWKKTAVTLIAAIGTIFVGVQYGAWIISAFLDAVANITLGAPVVQIALGTVMMAVAGIYGIYKAVERFYYVKGHETDPKIAAIAQQQLELSKLENRLEASQKNIALLENKLGKPPSKTLPHYDEEQFFSDINRRGPTPWTTFKKICTRAIYFINGGLTGVFLARLFFVKGTAIALPFVAASLSNPITIGILVGVGVAYGAFKVYQYHQQRKEEHAKMLLNQREERIECLKQEVIVASMREKLYTAEAKQIEAVANANSANSSQTAVIPFANVVDATLFGRPHSYSEGSIPTIALDPIIDPSSQNRAA